VRGIIITGGASDKIKYAHYASGGIEFFTYKVSFDPVEKIGCAGEAGNVRDDITLYR
jgi:hypothetical protein